MGGPFCGCLYSKSLTIWGVYEASRASVVWKLHFLCSHLVPSTYILPSYYSLRVQVPCLRPRACSSQSVSCSGAEGEGIGSFQSEGMCGWCEFRLGCVHWFSFLRRQGLL